MNPSAQPNLSCLPAPRGPDAPPPCVACGGYHGSIGFEMQCLKAALLSARAALKAAKEVPPAK